MLDWLITFVVCNNLKIKVRENLKNEMEKMKIRGQLLVAAAVVVMLSGEKMWNVATDIFVAQLEIKSIARAREHGARWRYRQRRDNNCVIVSIKTNNFTLWEFDCNGGEYRWQNESHGIHLLTRSSYYICLPASWLLREYSPKRNDDSAEQFTPNAVHTGTPVPSAHPYIRNW